MAPLRFKKNLMGSPMGELNYLVFDGWAIPRSGSFYLAGIEGRPIEISPNDVVGFFGGVGDPTGQLFHVERVTV
jgi:hypothetical protein